MATGTHNNAVMGKMIQGCCRKSDLSVAYGMRRMGAQGRFIVRHCICRSRWGDYSWRNITFPLMLVS